uniref:polyketide synthase dehydratase domain-containing protein n=1 Tax=Actinoalloteichus cyanogriseus TaxID=2893586 RepID=UPI0005576E41
REHFWLNSVTDGVDGAGFGLRRAEHPMLGATASLADSNAEVYGGRLSLDTHPWLAEHTVLGTTLVPGAVFADLATHIADQVGCAGVEELTLETGLVLPGHGAVQLQLVVGDQDERGSRPLTIHSRTGDDDWVRHATGVLAASTPVVTESLSEWPPTGATRV